MCFTGSANTKPLPPSPPIKREEDYGAAMDAAMRERRRSAGFGRAQTNLTSINPIPSATSGLKTYLGE